MIACISVGSQDMTIKVELSTERFCIGAQWIFADERSDVNVEEVNP